MKIETTELPGVVIIEPQVIGDERGFFMESFHETRYREKAGIKEKFVQDNRSHSSKGVLRGIHFQKTKPQGKLVHVTQGEVFDVAVCSFHKVALGWLSAGLSFPRWDHY